MEESELIRRFVTFPSDRRLRDVAIAGDEDQTRIYVSGRGGGRTMYLRRAEAVERAGPWSAGLPTYILPSDNHAVIDSEVIQSICAQFDHSDLTAKWQLLWRAAALSAVASNLLYNSELGRDSGAPVLDDDLEAGRLFQLDFNELLDLETRAHEPWCVYEQINYFEQRFRFSRTRGLTDHLRSEAWGQLERRLASTLQRCPPVALYIEAPDQEVRHAPRDWLPCQKGLFYFVWHLPESPRLAERLMVAATVPDIAYAKVLDGDKGDAFGPPTVRELRWTADSARVLLESKVGMLGTEELMIPRDPDPIRSWLGRDMIANVRRGRDEVLLDYLVSHTFAVPREIVRLGNDLTRLVRAAKQQGTEIEEQEIRDVVRSAAARFGRQRLSLCATELIAYWGEAAVEGRFADVNSLPRRDVSATEQTRGLVDALIDGLSDVGAREFRRSAFLESMKVHLPSVDTELINIMWRAGILGYVGRRDTIEREVFFDPGEPTRPSVPAGTQRFVLHRALFDTVELPVGDEGRGDHQQVATTANRNATTSARSGSQAAGREATVFISHASEDKADFVRPLADALERRGWHVWLDERLTVGESVVEEIDRAMARVRYGVIVISPDYLRKRWTRAELDALMQRRITDESFGGVLPVWHRVEREDVAQYSPLLADRLAASSSEGVEAVASRLHEAMIGLGSRRPVGQRPFIAAIPSEGSGGGRRDRVRQNDELDRLKHLLPAQLEEVIFRLGVADSYLPRETHAERAIALIRFVGVDRLEELESAIARAMD